jgi:hypothetical protein
LSNPYLLSFPLSPCIFLFLPSCMMHTRFKLT